MNTDNQGAFYFDSDMYSISGDDSVTFLTDESSKVSNIANFVGTLKSSASSNTLNGAFYSVESTLTGGVSTVGVATDGTDIIAVTGLSDNDTISGNIDDAAISMKGSSTTSTLTVQTTTFKLYKDTDGITITGKEITGLASGATLTANAAGTYTINGETIQISSDEDIIVGNGSSAYKKEVGDVEITSSTTTAEIVDQIVGTDTNISTLSASETTALLESDDKNGNLAITVSSAVEDEIDFSESTGVKNVELSTSADVKFNDEGGNVARIKSTASGETNVSLGAGGDLAVVESTNSAVNITAGAGNDTIVSSGKNVTVDLTAGGATKVMATSGKVVLENYNESTGAGIQSTSSNVAQDVADGGIDGANGSITVGGGVVEISSNSEEESTSTMVNIYNLKGKVQKVGFTNNDGGSVGSSDTKAAIIISGLIMSAQSKAARVLLQ